LDWSARVRCLQASYRVGELRKFGPANDVEIGSGDRVASDLDRPPLLIALYPGGDNSHKIDASCRFEIQVTDLADMTEQAPRGCGSFGRRVRHLT
jgi:hypothetical protein